MSEIFIKNRYLTELTDYGFMVLTGLLLHSNAKNIPDGKPGLVTQKIVAYELSATESKSLARAISAGFDELLEKGIISNIDRFHYLVDYSLLCCDDSFFTTVHDYEISRVMNYESHNKKSGLLKYMCTLFSTFDMKRKIGYMPQTYITEGLNKSLATIDKYNDILIELGIIGILKPNPYILKNGKMVKPTNIYYRPENVKTAIEYSKSRRLSVSPSVT